MALLSISMQIFFTSCNGGGSSTNHTPSPSSLREWGIAVLLENSSNEVGLPQIAVDNAGNAIAVWKQRDGSHIDIWANYFDGTEWGTAELIETDNIGNADSPQIAMDENGNAIAVWRQYDGNRFSIYFNYFNGTEWGTAETIETINTSSAYSPQIAMNGLGEAIVVWEQGDSAFTNIYVNYFDGSSWDTANHIETGDADSPQVAMDSNGNSIVVWRQTDSSPYNIWARYFNGTSWETAKLIDWDNNGSAYNPQIAMDGYGNATAVWMQFDGFRYNIWANYFDVDAGEDEEEEVEQWGTAGRIETDNRGNAEIPQIVMDDTGNAMVVWMQYDGALFSTYANRFDGSSWGTAELIESENNGDADLPQIAMNSTGTATAVWVQYDGIRFGIYANRFDGSSWGTAELIDCGDEEDEECNNGNADDPKIAMDNAGNAIAVWTQYDGDQFSIYANLFE
jgi:hypothetical protein